MRRLMAALTAALTLSGAALVAQAPGKNRLQDVSTIGCIRVWKPAPDDPTKMPDDRQPGLAGVYLLTPLSSDPASTLDLPTYLLTPSGTLNFAQHVGHKVEVTGTSQASTVRETVTSPTQRPENKPSTNGMPRLTVKTMKMVTESCP